MKVAIGSRGKSSNITGMPQPPKATDKNFYQWEENDLTIFSWIIQNLDNKLISSFAQHQTSKALWDSLVVAYGTGTADPFQIYDLEVRANKVSQAQHTLEEYWSNLQALWLAIDHKEPCPLDCCEKGINQYRKLISDRRLYQFLSGLDSRFDAVRRDILKEIPIPTAEAAFAKVRREAARSQILQPATNQTSEGGIGSGFATNAFSRSDSQHKPQKGNFSRTKAPSRIKEDKTKLMCTHCGMRKHTKEGCFQLIGYPEWWDDNHKVTTAKGMIAIGQGRDGNEQVDSGAAMAAAGTNLNGDGKKRGEEELSQIAAESGHPDWGDHWAWH